MEYLGILIEQVEAFMVEHKYITAYLITGMSLGLLVVAQNIVTNELTKTRLVKMVVTTILLWWAIVIFGIYQAVNTKEEE